MSPIGSLATAAMLVAAGTMMMAFPGVPPPGAGSRVDAPAVVTDAVVPESVVPDSVVPESVVPESVDPEPAPPGGDPDQPPADNDAGDPGDPVDPVGPVNSVPVSVAVPDLGIRATVIPTGLDAERGVIVPEDVMVTGWYTGSQPLGADAGATVIVGHRDSRTQGSGALVSIDQLAAGAIITAMDRDGTVYDYVVQTVEVLDKTRFPAEAPRIFAMDGPHRLTLITCGGAFDEAARSYESNVIVTAVALESRTGAAAPGG
jgi:sortase (surface protein transpeptidase)